MSRKRAPRLSTALLATARSAADMASRLAALTSVLLGKGLITAEELEQARREIDASVEVELATNPKRVARVRKRLTRRARPKG